jgi:PAT family beta-lactamase induction signal transducer AmpG
MRNPFAIFRSRRMAAVFGFGFSSGLPLALSGQTAQQWLYDEHIDVKTIATFASIGLPYTLKFLWAPLLDRYALPFLGRRRGWLLVLQIALVAAIIVASQLDPHSDPWRFATAALVIASLSATQDVVVDAYNTDILDPEQRAAGGALYIVGYRLAMFVSGAGALVMADHVVWSAVYLTMAAFMAIGIVTTLLAEEPERRARPPRTLVDAVVVPFTDFFKRYGRHAIVLLLFAALYKFAEQFTQAITGAFYRDVGFTKTEIGLASKLVVFFAFIVGGALGGPLVAKHGVKKTLVWFGCLQLAVPIGYLSIAYVGHDITFLMVALFVEYVASAMAGAAFTAALMSMCNPAVTATQMALFTALTSVGQRAFGWLSGPLITSVGYKGMFIVTIFMGFPGILFAWLALRNGPLDNAKSVAKVFD